MSVAATLRAGRRLGFSKRAVLGPAVRQGDAAGDADVASWRREARPVGEGCRAVDPPEARGEGADTGEPHREADVGDAAIRVAKQCRSALEAAGQEVLVWSLAEGAPELQAEVSRRQTGGASEVLYREGLEVP